MAQYVVGLFVLAGSVYLSRQGLVDAGQWMLLGGAWLLVASTRVVTGWGRPAWSVMFIAACALVVGWRSVLVFDGLSVDADRVLSSSRVELEAIVSEVPRLSAKSLGVVVDVRNSDDTGPELVSRMSVSLPIHTQIEYGSVLRLNGRMSPTSEIENLSYREYLEGKGVYATMFWPAVEVVGWEPPHVLVSWGWRSQRYLVERIDRLLPQDEAAFLLGVVLGASLPVSEKFDASLRNSGTTHIVVASGYNISVLLGMVLMVLGRWSRLAAYIVAVPIMIFYIFLSGADPSIIRATIMGVLLVMAMSMGRQHLVLYLLFMSALVMMLIYPPWLFHVGFQLSYMATLGLVLFSNSIQGVLSRMVPGVFVEVLSSTMAAQMLVYPIICYYFGQFSTISLLSNVLVLWITPVIMILGIVLAGMVLVSEGIAYWGAMMLYPWLWYIKQTIETTATIPMSLVDMTVGRVSVLAYYGVLAGVTWWRGMPGVWEGWRGER